MKKIVLSAFFGLAALAGCSASSGGSGLKVSAADFGDRWPLTVSGGELRCEGASSVVFEANGTKYSVNGTAMTVTDYADIDSIWADNAELGMGLKKDIGVLIDRGLDLCD